ncbi:MAG: Uncharacterised protein [Polaribacter sp. SA4-10]|nr:MAG: Uncharacterised protein [Polaribacter sp. SA4-10]
MLDSFQNIVVSSFPNILEVEFKYINRKYLKVILINITFVYLSLLAAVFFLEYKNILGLEEVAFWLFLFITILFIYTIFIKIIGFKRRKFLVREKDISYKKGVFYKKITTVPFNRIQHVEIDQGPISRFFNLASLSVFTAGDSSDDLKVNGLLKDEAQQIKEYISNQIDG